MNYECKQDIGKEITRTEILIRQFVKRSSIIVNVPN